MNTEVVFKKLKDILSSYEKKLQVVHNQPDNYYLHTPASSKLPKGEFFGAVQIKKSYVAFHLMPVYYHPELLKTISDTLKKHMQGKSCFNFKNADSALFSELKQLTDASYKKYRELGSVNQAVV
jgi:hypothetical protein